MEAGGAISHHHGIGKIRRDFVRDTVSDATIALLHDIKHAQDPKNVFGIANNIFAPDVRAHSEASSD